MLFSATQPLFVTRCWVFGTLGKTFPGNQSTTSEPVLADQSKRVIDLAYSEGKSHVQGRDTSKDAAHLIMLWFFAYRAHQRVMEDTMAAYAVWHFGRKWRRNMSSWQLPYQPCCVNTRVGCWVPEYGVPSNDLTATSRATLFIKMDVLSMWFFFFCSFSENNMKYGRDLKIWGVGCFKSSKRWSIDFPGNWLYVMACQQCS